MLRRIQIISALFFILFSACNRNEPPEITLWYNENRGLEYHEVIDAYKNLANHYRKARLFEKGNTDSGKPLHLFMISGDGDFNPSSLKEKGKSIILINNGIHAGEPAGVDASLKYAADLLAGKNGLHRVLDSTVIAIIPVHNVGGFLNLSRYHRMNQDGPEFKGARRNARNLDLNRDFVKMDSQNAWSFAGIFHFLDPDVLLDTHTTNGSDHHFVMTLISTMHQKLPPPMGEFFSKDMVPELYRRMNDETPYGMIPYVQQVDRSGIRSGIAGFNDHAFYSSGFASLFNTFSFMTENLVYKPFPERVRSTYEFIRFLAEFTSSNTSAIRRLRNDAASFTAGRREYVLDWELDADRHDKVFFRGYETEQAYSSLTNRIVTAYDRNRPWADTIPFYNYFKPSATVTAPGAYIIPGAWPEVIDRMVQNGVTVELMEKDTVLLVETIYIDGFQVSAQPNQGRHLVTITQKRQMMRERQFYAGDALIRLNQPSNNYIVHMLEPESPVSFLRWGFFTSALEDGEAWSIWGFEDEAKRILDSNPELRTAYNRKMDDDLNFASSPAARLQYIYNFARISEIERGAHLYPVARLPVDH